MTGHPLAHPTLDIRTTVEPLTPPNVRYTTSSGSAVAEWGKFIVNYLVNADGEPLDPHPEYAGEFVKDDVGLYQRAVITLDGPAPVEGSVTITASGNAKAGTHYTIPGGNMVTIPEGSSSVVVPVQVIDVGQWFRERHLVLTLTSAVGVELGGQRAFDLFIRPATAAPTVSLDSAAASGAHDGGAINLPFTLSSAAADDVQVWGVVTGGSASSSDYTLNTSVTAPVVVAAGSTTGNVTLTWTGAAPGSNETVDVELLGDYDAQRNLYSFSESPDHVVGAGATGFPTLGQGNYLDTAGQARGDSIGQTRWTAEPAGRVNPDGTQSYRLIPIDTPGDDTPEYLRKDYSNFVPGGIDQYQRLATRNTLSAYVKRPADPEKESARWALSIRDRTGVKAYAAYFGWPTAGKPTFYAAESIELDDLVSYNITIHDTTSGPDDPHLGAGWYRVAFEIEPPAGSVNSISNRFVWAARAGGGQTMNQAITQERGLVVWGVQWEEGSLSEYQPRPGQFFDPKGGARRTGTYQGTITVTP